MKKKVSRRLWISREVRIAIIVALFALGGVYALTHHARGFGLLLIGVAAALTAASWYFLIRPARIPHDAVVAIRLAGPIHEDPLLTPLDQLRRRGLLSMRSLRYALESVAADADVRGIIVEIAGPQAGVATCHEIQRLLRAAHLRGKRVVALLSGDSAGVRDLLIASGASEVVANPDTMLELLGVAAGSVFLKSGLEKLGVHAQTLQWKEYKGAAETFSRDAMSPALRESLDAIVADARKVLAEAIAEARNLPAERVDGLLSA